MKPLRRLGMRYPCCHAHTRTFLVAQPSPSPRSTSIPIWGRIMYGNFLPFVSLRTLALGIALLSLARTSAAQFVPASPPIADPADTRFKGVSEDWRVTILNLPVLPLKLMIRKSHIPRIANDIDYFSISWVKILVRLYNSWASVYV